MIQVLQLLFLCDTDLGGNLGNVIRRLSASDTRTDDLNPLYDPEAADTLVHLLYAYTTALLIKVAY